MSAAIHAAHAGVTVAWAEQVELLEDRQAEVVSLKTGRSTVVSRQRLPSGAREGDVIMNGEVDAVRTEAMSQRVRTLQARAVRAPASLEEVAPETGPR